ncbi:MAG: hypothetical protein AAFQ43_11940 [Bacteroidota bacterium]
MTRLRPLFASALLSVAFLGTVVAPAVHWAGHALDGHEATAEVADGAPSVEATEDGHAGDCPDCAHLQKVLGAEPTVAPFYTDLVGLEQAETPPDAPAIQNDVATPEERGPPEA